jgi:hypothetical protein
MEENDHVYMAVLCTIDPDHAKIYGLHLGWKLYLVDFIKAYAIITIYTDTYTRTVNCDPSNANGLLELEKFGNSDFLPNLGKNVRFRYYFFIKGKRTTADAYDTTIAGPSKLKTWCGVKQQMHTTPRIALPLPQNKRSFITGDEKKMIIHAKPLEPLTTNKFTNTLQIGYIMQHSILAPPKPSKTAKRTYTDGIYIFVEY